MANESTIAQLIIKLLRQDITVQERQELEAWRAVSAANSAFLDKVTQRETMLAGLRALANMDMEEKYRWVPATNRKEPEVLPRIPFMVRYRRGLMAAAALAGAVAIGVYLFTKEGTKPKAADTTAVPVVATTITNVDRAVLTLADGRTVDLGKAQSGLLADESAAKVYKLENNLIRYTPGTAPASVQAGYNTISVPHGARFRVMLPDQTEVVLNTGSTLRYPVVFTGDNRTVELKGEAFFSVKKDKSHPFIVSSDRLRVQVMGTAFSMRDYPGETIRRTVVKDGAVEVKSKEGTARLRPGQEARIDEETSSLRVISGVDAASILAWKNGYFNFDDLDIRAAIWQLAQWYGMRVHFAKDVKRGVLGSGNIQQDLPLSQLLKDLELPDLRFAIKDSTIMVTTR